MSKEERINRAYKIKCNKYSPEDLSEPLKEMLLNEAKREVEMFAAFSERDFPIYKCNAPV